jgi:aminoglycoside phosphotransferase (APT) family kinase protein
VRSPDRRGAGPITPAELPDALLAQLGAHPRLTFPPQGATSDVAFAGTLVLKRARTPLYRDWLRHEHAVLRALVGAGLPVPRPHAFVEQPDQSWLLMERLPGQPLDRVLRRTDDAAARSTLLRDLGATLAAIHATPPPASLAAAGPWLDAALAQAADNLAHHPVDGDAALLERLRRDRPADVPPRLIHGDAAIDNFLAADGRLTAIVDWSSGAAGDPRYDLALATQRRRGAFTARRDLDAFYEGYGGSPLSAAEARWFVGLYEFF